MKKYILHVAKFTLSSIFLAWSYILTLYLHNIGELTTPVLLRPLFLVFATGLFISTAVYFFFQKHTIIVSIFLSVLTILFFSYRDFGSYIGSRVLTIGQMNFGKNHILFILYIGIIASLYLFIKRFPKYTDALRSYLFLFSVFSIILPIFNIIRYESTQRATSDVHSHFVVPDIAVHKKLPEIYPDIYYIVPDSYSSGLNMEKYFGYDDTPFTDYLKQKGFYVVEKATSNYPKTYLSISSTLNMEYLDYLSVYKDSTNETLVDPLFKENSVLVYLLKNGYSYYQLGSWWGPTQYNRLATHNYNLDLQNPLGINTFDTLILEASLLKPLLPDSILKSVVTESVEDKRRRTIYQFDTLKEITGLPGPKFIFAHIIAPHGPNVFGRNCEFITQESLAGLSDEQGYSNQVDCINIKIKETVDAILRTSKKPSVILIQSDEGAPFLSERVVPTDNWDAADAQLLKKKFPILSAYYFPDGDYSSLYPTMTSVNSFRVILNSVFNLQIPLLEDRNYIMLDMNHRYDYRDVTKDVQLN